MVQDTNTSPLKLCAQIAMETAGMAREFLSREGGNNAETQAGKDAESLVALHQRIEGLYRALEDVLPS